eukprot:TRINITY_DN16218_c0_g1_i3.p1 TRINITY_DN16218_c0_g1~~TRINITY_DN16218_c0_g1_i3.p1  ORF type:complete len:132 (+),score=1.62 TRINITY_DN16218_c0_g1_i3:202-597(+)
MGRGRDRLGAVDPETGIRKRRKSADNHGPRDPELKSFFGEHGFFETDTLLEYEKKQIQLRREGKVTKLDRDKVIKSEFTKYSTVPIHTDPRTAHTPPIILVYSSLRTLLVFIYPYPEPSLYLGLCSLCLSR